jgi:hypothetical protein
MIGGEPILVTKEDLITSGNASDVWWQLINVDSGILRTDYMCATPTLH